jgi:hypothetical protein
VPPTNFDQGMQDNQTTLALCMEARNSHSLPIACAGVLHLYQFIHLFEPKVRSGVGAVEPQNRTHGHFSMIGSGHPL